MATEGNRVSDVREKMLDGRVCGVEVTGGRERVMDDVVR